MEGEGHGRRALVLGQGAVRLPSRPHHASDAEQEVRAHEGTNQAHTSVSFQVVCMDLNLEELDMEETVGKDTALYIDGVRPQQPQAVPSVSMLPPSYTPFCGPRSYASVASNKNKGKGKGKGHNCFQKFRLSLHTTHRWCTRLRFQGGEGGWVGGWPCFHNLWTDTISIWRKARST